MNFSELQIEDMELFIETKQGMLSHQERLLDVLSLLNQIQNPEACDDNIPFCFDDYFVDGEHYLGKAIWIIQEAFNTLDADAIGITQSHFNEVKEIYLASAGTADE
jgi:hypothetical protein